MPQPAARNAGIEETKMAQYVKVTVTELDGTLLDQFVVADSNLNEVALSCKVFELVSNELLVGDKAEIDAALADA